MYNSDALLFNEENQTVATNALWMISSCLHESAVLDNEVATLSAYLLYKVAQRNNSCCSFSALISGGNGVLDEATLYAKEVLNSEVWDKLNILTKQFDYKAFAFAALLPLQGSSKQMQYTTPNSIVELSKEILKINSNDRVADIGCGVGNFLVSSALSVPEASYFGCDTNSHIKTIATMRSEIIGKNIKIELQDAFSLLNLSNHSYFNKIFSNYPFGLRLRNLGAGELYLNKLSDKYPGLSKSTSSDWIFNALIYDLLTPVGKAIGIMTNGSTWNTTDKMARKLFVEKGMIECVISLPDKLFDSTNIPTTLIVLSHGNKNVRLIDATKICHQGRRQNKLSQSDISTIMSMFNTNSENSQLIDIDALRENDYSLSLSRYQKQDYSISDGKPFGSVIKSITRGAPCTASQLDKMVSDEITAMQYLMLANIQNGLIDNKLPYLSSIDSKYEKYCLKNNCLILSKNGYPYKVAVATVRPDQKILANGNLYVVELDEKQVNPYYVKAFFESEQGVAVLKSITVGATIPNIGVDMLKKVIIPIPSIEVQNRIALKYRTILDEVEVLKLRLEKAVTRLHHVFDEGSEEC